MAAADAARLVARALERSETLRRPSAPTPVVAAGKAAWRMFSAAAEVFPIGRAVIATDARAMPPPPSGVDVFDAGHPAPNEASVAAGERALELAHESAAAGGLLVLLSGGASAMMAAPAAGVSLQDKVETARRLMAAGAAIDELNCVRKHLSRIKGGGLAAAAAGRTVTLALSDVHGPVADDPAVIASGPTVPDPTTFAAALEIVRARRVDLPSAARVRLERGARGDVPETVKPGDPRLAHSAYVVVGNRASAAEGAARAARARGYHVVTIEEATRGEAREAGCAFVDRALRLAGGAPRPVCVIATGETTVTVRGPGRGGRNQEFALAAASRLQGVAVLGSAGTDGIDGPTDAAGALADRTTLERARQRGVDPAAALAANDSYRLFDAIGDLIRWGPTGTNVGDLHVLLLGGASAADPASIPV